MIAFTKDIQNHPMKQVAMNNLLKTSNSTSDRERQKKIVTNWRKDRVLVNGTLLTILFPDQRTV